MRFIALTTIAALAFASVSAIPVDTSNGVGGHSKDIPLSKRTEQVGYDGPPSHPPFGTDKVYHKPDAAEGATGGIYDLYQGQKPPSKRTEQVGNAAPVPDSGNGQVIDDPDAAGQAGQEPVEESDEEPGENAGGPASQGQKPPSKRTEQVSGDDDLPRVPLPPVPVDQDGDL
jgi:hypothetical protein